MNIKQQKKLRLPFLVVALFLIFLNCSRVNNSAVLDQTKLAIEYFQEDAQWYLDNIPFFECSDKEIEKVYYYRWKLYKAHIRDIGENEFVITEFINHVPWDREPFCTINAASMHHIYEGRWLKDKRYMDGYINYLLKNGGNNRQYSESISDAAYARYLVNADSSFILSQLDSMKSIYNQWYDHWDSSKNLYYIPAMPDATEYTIASIDASGGKGGFEDGEAFRPTINSYMYGNAMAISHIAAMKGDQPTSRDYLARASALRSNVERDLWNDSFQHFTDRFKVNNEFVHYWDFIRGRELAGLIPWYFNLPGNDPRFGAAWRHLMDTTALRGQFGMRTNEPSYQYYFKQFVYSYGKRGSQWNGPSWPYQTSLVLTAMANVLNNYDQNVIDPSDYLTMLRLFTRQHILPDGKINLVEDYDPNLGGPIVYFYWSNHYNHSSYNNLVISGLCGIRPSSGDTLDLHPLVDDSIQYFCLEDVLYHGHRVTLLYDKDGTKYKEGKGLTVFVDGKKAELLPNHSGYRVMVGKPLPHQDSPAAPNLAVNIWRKGYPLPSASVNNIPDSVYQAVDGRIWYFPEIMNRWSTMGSTTDNDWFMLDFGEAREISSVKVYSYTEAQKFDRPDRITVEYADGDQWLPVKLSTQQPTQPEGNNVNTFVFSKVSAKKIRVNFSHKNKAVAITELACY